MSHRPSALLCTLAAVLSIGALLSAAAPSAAAPAAQDSTPTVEATTEPGADATGEATAAPTGPSPNGTATLTAVDTSAFPELNAYLLVNDANGARIGALPPSAFALSENGVPVPGLTVSETDVGVQVVFVIDANDAFSARDATGINRLQHVAQALNAFATTPPRLKPGVDLVTVLTAEGPVVERTDNPALVTQALAGYDSTFGGAADPFPLLHRALDYAVDVTLRPGMLRYVVYLSNGWNRFDVDAGVTDIATRARAGGVSVYTVFVGPTGADSTLGSQNLLRLAEAAGGERFIFNGPDSLTPLFQHLSDRGRQYRLSYRSSLDITGQHSLAAGVSLPGSTTLTSNEAVFPLRVEAPKLTLEGTPPTVVRVASGADPGTAYPTVMDVPVNVDFADGHPRGLRLAQLLVNGQAVVTQTNTSELRTFRWSLADYPEGGEYQLQARIIDELGLAAESEVVPVTLSVQAPAANTPSSALPLPLPLPGRNWRLLWMALGGLGLALAVGLGAWWWLARRQQLAEAQAAFAALDEATMAAPPVPRSQPAQAEAAAAPKAAGRPHVAVPAFRWPSRLTLHQPKGLCYFEVVEPSGGGAPRPDIDLVGPHLTLGRDAAVADTVFHDRSVSRLHARVLLQDHCVRIIDQDSTSGTWVNYTPVQGQAGCELQHGDLVNLGRVQLRFLRRDAPPANGNGARVTPAAPPHGPGPADAGANHKAGA